MVERTLKKRLEELAGPFPVVFLTGPRQSGKTTLARATFQHFAYVSLEDRADRRHAVDDPRGFLRRFHGKPGVILDEAQRAPDLFSYIQGVVDEGRAGPFVLTGSQNFLLSESISQSLAGRAAVLELLPFSVAELSGRPARVPDAWLDPPAGPARPPTEDLDGLLFRGLFPPVHARGLDARVWYDGYVRTYVERDVRLVGGIGDLDAFERFLGLCAGRAGQILNLSGLGSDAGVSHVTARKWLSVLRASYVVDLLMPHARNFRKRLTRSPKIHFTDPGLLCHLLGIRHVEDLRRHPLRGAVFESFVVSELRKAFQHAGERAPLFFWRDHAGHEVDVIMDLGVRTVPIEIKSGSTLAADSFRGLDYYARLSGVAGGVLVHGGEERLEYGDHLAMPWFACT